MNKVRFIIISGVALALTSSMTFYRTGYINDDTNIVQDTLIKYPDGKYTGQSRSIYIDEPYWGRVSFTLTKGVFSDITFMIRDSNLHETFDTIYGKHFQGNEVYIQQCRNDWMGVQSYPAKLTETQDIDKLDAISGATWSYNIFKASVHDALKKEQKRSE
jgi:major membrane immunogen (membrane-anchored lipoprotein)